MGISQDLYKKAKKIIPGGTQLLSKRPEMFLPDFWPSYYSKAKGCFVWDLDGNKYVDTSYMGIGANILGYADEDIDSAVKNIIDKGSMCTLNAPEEVELADTLIGMHDWADMVRYAKTGGEAMAIAVRIARAFTEKDIILFCGYHGWSDWYLAANLNEDTALDGHLLKGLNPLGVPRGLLGTCFPFEYNDLEEFNKLMIQYKGKIAAVVMEPIRNSFPHDGFLDEIRKQTLEEGIVLVFDEITSGFRLTCGGAHLSLGVDPDIAVLGKALSNGYPMAAIIGKKEIMNIAQDTFISSTYWTDRVGLAASIATINKYRKYNVQNHLNQIGEKVKQGWIEAGRKNSIEIQVSGIAPLGHFEFLYENKLALKTLFTQIMLQKGYLATNAFYVSLAHDDQIVDMYLENVDKTFNQIKEDINKNNVENELIGKICHSGFQRLT